MSKIMVHIKHVSWRDGRPRFEPGPALRALGYKGEDLKGPDGAWLSLQQAQDWLDKRLAEIAQRRRAAAAGQRLKRVARGAIYTIEDLFDDMFASARLQRDAPAAPAQAADAKRPNKRSDIGRNAPRTIADYKNKAAAFESFDIDFYRSPAASVTKPIVLGLHEQLWDAKGLPMANGMMAVLRRAFSIGVNRGRVHANPCLKLELPAAEARLRVGTPAELEALLKAADDPKFDDMAVGDAIAIALYTVQRQADVLELEARNEDKGRVRFIQNKTGARVMVPAVPQLLARLSAIRERRAGAIGSNSVPQIVFNPRTKAAFKSDDFRHRFSALRARAAKACPSLTTFLFMDLRDTGVTRLALAGCTVPEIAAISGHSMETIHAIMKHYLELNEAHADAAIDKLIAWMEREGVRV